MRMKIVECVPNFSEGRDREKIEAIANAVRSVSGVSLLDVDPGEATNRTVFTFAGPPEPVLEAAFQAIKAGSELIDMRTHKGSHARQGACDVCPFVPVSGVTMEECVELANRLGRRVGEELKIPVYLYAKAAKKPERERMPDIRTGEYEALEEKLKKPEWKPDYGAAKFNAKAGATVIGARPFLIAYNVNLNSTNVKLAKKIAFEIRETGKLKHDKDGNKVMGPDGKAERVPGMFKNVQGTGWLIPEYNRAQITVNILDLDTAPVHEVFDACCDLATKFGSRVTGSEVVGMVPKRVMIEAGLHYLKKQGSTTGVCEDEIIRTAVMSLGLTDVAEFDPKHKIIEERFMEPAPLASMTVDAFTRELASNSPAPGGGSVAAVAGAMSAGLASMVAALTFDKKGLEELKPEMERVGVKAQEVMAAQLRAIDSDTAAFNKVMDALSMPKGTDEQQAARAKAVEEANKGATMEPLHTLERTIPALECAAVTAERGNPNSLSDAGVAALMARAGAWGAYYNVLINLQGIEDEKWCKEVRRKADELIKEAEEKASAIEKIMIDKLGG
jgi:glutamate formiminotransferase/formiminotetrahydrofolate cyclodeaminase